jgi:preprotein translocase subunit SecE
MAKDQGSKTQGRPPRRGPAAAPARPPAAQAAAPAAAVAKPRFNPVQFSREVRAEARKITWTSWKETWVTSVMVFIMVVVTAIFFLLVDGGLGFLVQQFLRLAG